MPRGISITVLVLLPVLAAAEDEKPFTPAEAAHAFKQKCQGCHTIPDAESAFDRAWLDQVNRTA